MRTTKAQHLWSCYLDNIIPLVPISKTSSLYLASVAARPVWVYPGQKPRRRFLVTRLIWDNQSYCSDHIQLTQYQTTCTVFFLEMSNMFECWMKWKLVLKKLLNAKRINKSMRKSLIKEMFSTQKQKTWKIKAMFPEIRQIFGLPS